MTAYTHETFMPFGRYKLFKLKDLPKDYLLELFKNKSNEPKILEYIDLNLEEIKNRSNSIGSFQNLSSREIRKTFTNCEKVGFVNKKEANFQLNKIKNNPKTQKIPVRSYECEICGAWHHTSKE